MKTFFQRLTEPTPAFFQVIRNLGASLVAIAIFFMALQAKGYILPSWVSWGLNFYTIAGGLVMTLVSQLTSIWRNEDGTINEVKKANYLKEKEKE